MKPPDLMWTTLGFHGGPLAAGVLVVNADFVDRGEDDGRAKRE